MYVYTYLCNVFRNLCLQTWLIDLCYNILHSRAMYPISLWDPGSLITADPLRRQLCAQVTENPLLHSNNLCKITILPCYNSFINSSAARVNDRHFADDIFKCILMDEKNAIWWVFSRRIIISQLTNIGSGNGLAANRWRVITWCNTDLQHWPTYVAPTGVN